MITSSISYRKSKAYDILGNKCSRCGFDDIGALQIDHVNSNGKQERVKNNRNQVTLYKNVIDANGKGYQLLCANCNWLKRVSNKENNCVELMDTSGTNKIPPMTPAEKSAKRVDIMNSIAAEVTRNQDMTWRKLETQIMKGHYQIVKVLGYSMGRK